MVDQVKVVLGDRRDDTRVQRIRIRSTRAKRLLCGDVHPVLRSSGPVVGGSFRPVAKHKWRDTQVNRDAFVPSERLRHILCLGVRLPGWPDVHLHVIRIRAHLGDSGTDSGTQGATCTSLSIAAGEQSPPVALHDQPELFFSSAYNGASVVITFV